MYYNLSTLYSRFEYNVLQQYIVFEIVFTIPRVQCIRNLNTMYSIWGQYIPIWVHCFLILSTMYSKITMYLKFEYNVIPIWVESVQFEYNGFKVEYNVFQFEYIVFTIWGQCILRVKCIRNLSTMYSNLSTMNSNLNTIY